MGLIVESRTLAVSRRIFTLADIARIAECLSRAADRAPQVKTDDGNPRAELAFSAAAADRSSYQSSSAEIFAPDSPLALKPVTKVSLQLRAYPSRSYVDIRLRHGQREGEVEVSGPDRNWVAGVLADINETIGSFAPQQDPVFLRHPILFRLAVAYGIGLAIPRVIGLVLAWTLEPFLRGWHPTAADWPWVFQFGAFMNEHPYIDWWLSWGLMPLVIGFGWGGSFFQWLDTLWPSIELQIGPEHTRQEKQKRAALAAAWSLAIIPLAVSAVFELLKSSALAK